MSADPMGPIRLNKRLAQLGAASRRGADRLITEGRVKVNGRLVTELGTAVAPGARITIDGHELSVRAAELTGALYKPPGYLCTRDDPQGRKTIYELLPADLPFMAHVGRLDFNTEGLLLLTTDGELAQQLLLPANAVPRTYEVKIRGRLSPEAVRKIEAGIALDGRPTRPVEVERTPTQSKHDWLRLTLFEGRNRHVHRLIESVGSTVTRLRRVSFGGVELGDLPMGGFRLLDDSEIHLLRGFR
jgi:23S rRNA pseudouridine2605 synthase